MTHNIEPTPTGYGRIPHEGVSKAQSFEEAQEEIHKEYPEAAPKRRWYSRKRVLLPVVGIVGLALGSAMGAAGAGNTTSTTPATVVKEIEVLKVPDSCKTALDEAEYNSAISSEFAQLTSDLLKSIGAGDFEATQSYPEEVAALTAKLHTAEYNKAALECRNAGE